jgi:ABC-2 type transport system permease protein
MNRNAIVALIRNDIRLFLSDRRAVIVSVLVPILIAAFFGYVFSSAGKEEDQGKIPIAVVDEDLSKVSQAITTDLSSDKLLQVNVLDRTAAQAQVRSGKQTAAAVFPKGFGEQTTRALFTGRDKPQVELLIDPSQAIGARVIEGLLAQYSMQEISREAFTGDFGAKAVDDYLTQLEMPATTEGVDPASRADLKQLLQAVQRLNKRNREPAAPDGADPRTADNPPAATPRSFGLSIPYTVASTEVTARSNVAYNGYAHSFAGMTVQFILMAGIDAGILLLTTRQRGIWQRLRSAPLRRSEFLIARALATTAISLFQFLVIYLAAELLFRVRIEGSVPGFLLIAVAFCLLNAAFGLMLATLGRSPATTRGVSLMVILLLVMIGGAWVPAFIFPRWLQSASLLTPTRWAVDGLDAVTWRGLPFHSAVAPAVILLASALVCLSIAIARFRWEE